MAAMATKRQGKGQVEGQADGWLWPTALVVTLIGWGQTLWLWNNSPPEGLVRLWFLLWAGVGVAGVTLALYWFASRWWPVAWLAVAVWIVVPSINELTVDQAGGWLYDVAPFLLWLSLGVGLSGAMLIVGWYVGRRWPGPVPKIRPLRQGLWSGLFVLICGWLLIYRNFSPIPVFFLASALILIETFFVVRESPRE